jgi:hypothetical protein
MFQDYNLIICETFLDLKPYFLWHFIGVISKEVLPTDRYKNKTREMV